MVGVLYYNPNFGGMLFLNSRALLDFFTILFLDKRISLFSKIYEIFDYSFMDYKESWFIFLKLKVNYIVVDILQILDSVYVNPFDFFYFLYFYTIYLFSYFGP